MSVGLKSVGHWDRQLIWIRKKLIYPYGPCRVKWSAGRAGTASDFPYSLIFNFFSTEIARISQIEGGVRTDFQPIRPDGLE